MFDKKAYWERRNNTLTIGKGKKAITVPQPQRGQGEYPNLVVAEYTPEAWDELKLKEKQGVTDKNPVRQQKT